ASAALPPVPTPAPAQAQAQGTPVAPAAAAAATTAQTTTSNTPPSALPTVATAEGMYKGAFPMGRVLGLVENGVSGGDGKEHGEGVGLKLPGGILLDDRATLNADDSSGGGGGGGAGGAGGAVTNTLPGSG
ncbi:unnamed protein product, partial [Laminaria digitata]